mgnify:CR=1 FL=1
MKKPNSVVSEGCFQELSHYRCRTGSVNPLVWPFNSPPDSHREVSLRLEVCAPNNLCEHTLLYQCVGISMVMFPIWTEIFQERIAEQRLHLVLGDPHSWSYCSCPPSDSTRCQISFDDQTDCLLTMRTP